MFCQSHTPTGQTPESRARGGGGSGGRRLGTGCTPSPWIFSEDRLRTLRNGKKHHANWNLDWPCVIHQPNDLKLRLKKHALLRALPTVSLRSLPDRRPPPGSVRRHDHPGAAGEDVQYTAIHFGPRAHQ